MQETRHCYRSGFLKLQYSTAFAVLGPSSPVLSGFEDSEERSACGDLGLYLTKIKPNLEKIVLSHQAHPLYGNSASNKD